MFWTDTSLEVYSSVWQCISGLCQSMGWGTNIAILSNWFPKRGRGILLGIWASNANIGDIIGNMIYRSIVGNSKDMWGWPLIVIGIMTIVLGVINMLWLYEFPIQKGYVIDEESEVYSECIRKRKKSDDLQVTQSEISVTPDQTRREFEGLL